MGNIETLKLNKKYCTIYSSQSQESVSQIRLFNFTILYPERE